MSSRAALAEIERQRTRLAAALPAGRAAERSEGGDADPRDGPGQGGEPEQGEGRGAE